MKKIEFTKEQLEDIFNKYQNEKLSMSKIGEVYGVSKTVISRVLKENSIEINKDNHIYKADYRKFEIIDTQEKAYWLGFLAADGCNYWRQNNASIIINIHNKDRKHLEKFKSFMNSDVNIIDFIQNFGFSNNTPMSKIIFNSKEMSIDLSNKGVVPNKSLILKPPIIEDKYFYSFILGYFDGDGSIFKTSQNNNYVISIEGTKEILEWINNLLNISSKLEKRKEDNKNNYYIRCGGTNKPFEILKKLYDASPVHLDRKYKIYKSLETVVLNGNIKRSLDGELLESL